jgi:Glyoxalase-like domain
MGGRPRGSYCDVPRRARRNGDNDEVAEPNLDIVIDCTDPEVLAEFWAEALGYTKAGFFEPYFVLLPPVREPVAPPPAVIRATHKESRCIRGFRQTRST